ncbi:MAG: hypothetical protein N5P05_002036 [Chroococcopsis gigantea SAG 12.99]|nr:hypothetical protein [Chroococcopsis gigantea SAG 12.99]
MSDISPDKKYKFFHLVNPENSTAKLIKEPPYDKESYCALIAVRASKDVPVEKNINNNSSWNKVWSKPPITILIIKNNSIALVTRQASEKLKISIHIYILYIRSLK